MTMLAILRLSSTLDELGDLAVRRSGVLGEAVGDGICTHRQVQTLQVASRLSYISSISRFFALEITIVIVLHQDSSPKVVKRSVLVAFQNRPLESESIGRNLPSSTKL